MFCTRAIVFEDQRGFLETFNQEKFQKLLEKQVDFVQDNVSYSSKGVLRELHYQKVVQAKPSW